MKHVLITGANSYIGDSFAEYLQQWPEEYSVTIKDTIGWNPEPIDFKGYDVVFNVAGIAHIKETKENRHFYFDINRDLVIRIAKACKDSGINQFILLSTMSVYGLTTGHITKASIEKPVNAYGKSKTEADYEIRKLENENFVFTCLRPPMVYGKNCKGNYQTLRKFALKSCVFPDYSNMRSMVYIGNLCEFVKQCIDLRIGGVFFPQNSEYTNTSKLVQLIAQNNEKQIRLTKVFNWAIRIMPFNVFKKVFGNLTYEKVDLVNKFSFDDSVFLSEVKDS